MDMKKEEILDDLNEILDLDMDKKFEKVHFLEKEGVFACAFKNGREYFLKKEDLPEYDGSRIKNCTLDKDEYYFNVILESGFKYTVPWDFVLHMCEEKYEFHKSKRVKEARNRKGLRQVDLAQKTGILRANIARIERGKHNPSLETLERISDALGIPVVDLIAK